MKLKKPLKKKVIKSNEEVRNTEILVNLRPIKPEVQTLINIDDDNFPTIEMKAPVQKPEIAVATQSNQAPPPHVCHNAIAFQVANRIIKSIKWQQGAIERLLAHPGLTDQSKQEMANYLQRNILSSVWCLAPAFVIATGYVGIDELKSLYEEAVKSRGKGLLEDEKYF